MTDYSQAPPPQPPPVMYPPRRKSYWWVWVIVAVVVLGCMALAPFIFIGAIAATIAGAAGTQSGVGPGVAIIRINGTIAAGKSSSGFTSATTGSESIIDQIDKALKSDDARAIVLRINSPGGSAAGSEEVYAKLMSIRGKKPIIVSMGDVAASGGYYIASAADEIYCNGGTTTGSIGVINSHMDLSGLMKKVGVTSENITSGKYKDMGSPTRPLTADERGLLKKMIDDIYNQFVDAVAKGRNMPRGKVLKIADGRVFSGRQAKALGLVDEIGGMDKAVEKAGQRAGLQSPIRKIEYGRQGFFSDLLSTESESDSLTPMARKLLLQEAAKELAGGTMK
jgi:protease IV